MIRKDTVLKALTQEYHYYDVVKITDGNDDEGFIVDSNRKLVGENGFIENIAWNWLKVEWYDKDSDMNTNVTRGHFINPWEITTISNKLSTSPI